MPSEDKRTVAENSTRKRAVEKLTTPPSRLAVNEDDLRSSLGYSLRRAQLSTYKVYAAAFDENGVRPAQYSVMMLIRSNPGVSQSAVSQALDIQKANLVTLLDALEHKGWTERRSVPGDRRTSALFLTKAGQTFLRKVEATHQQMEARVLERLGEARSAQLLKLLHAFCDADTATPAEG